jgi:hypothetical protein
LRYFIVFLEDKFYECPGEPDIVAVLMGPVEMRGKEKIFNNGDTGVHRVDPSGVAVDFSMGGIEILQSGDGARSGSMGLDR